MTLVIHVDVEGTSAQVDVMVPGWAIPLYSRDSLACFLPWFAADAGHIPACPKIRCNCPRVPLYPARNVWNAAEYVHFLEHPGTTGTLRGTHSVHSLGVRGLPRMSGRTRNGKSEPSAVHTAEATDSRPDKPAKSR